MEHKIFKTFEIYSKFTTKDKDLLVELRCENTHIHVYKEWCWTDFKVKKNTGDNNCHMLLN